MAEPLPERFTFPEWTVIREYSDQSERLIASGVDPSFYGKCAEIGLYGLDGFRTMTRAGMNIDGYVLLEMRYRQKGFIYLDQPLLIRGQVAAVSSTEIGPKVHHVYTLSRQTGEIALINDIIGITAEPEEFKRPRSKKPSEKYQREPDPTEGFVLVQEKQITPTDVRTFCEDAGNKIHFDRELAVKYGFSAPLAPGVMSAVWLISALARKDVPRKMDATINFLRPIFWEDEAWLWGKPDSTGRGSYEIVRSINAMNKVTAEMWVNELVY